MKKVVLYARVSSNEQEKHGFSIPAQIKFLREYAQKHDFVIVKEFSESETAKQAGRTEFNNMVKFVKTSKDVKTILVEKTDRLYRNFKDYVKLEDEDLEIHLVKENEIIGKNAPSHTKLTHGFKLLIAKNYIDNLREETMKGMREKAEQGIFPNRAPYGYKNIRNQQGKNDIAVDEVNAPFIRRAFEIYSSGNVSIEDTSQQLLDEGFLYRTYSRRIPRSALELILKNPFYTGKFRFRGEIMDGKHTPLISEKLFKKVQDAFKKDGKSLYKKHSFLLGNLLTCGSCGCSIVGEIKKKKYIYYHCSWGHGKSNCENRKYYNEQELLSQLDNAIKAIDISTELKDEILECMQELNEKEQIYHKENLSRLNATATRLRNEISAIYQDKLDGVISLEQWQVENEIRQQKLTAVKIQIDAFDTTNNKFMDEVNSIIELANGLYSKYLSGSDTLKVKILKTVLSNSTLNGGTVVYTYKKPFCYIAEMANSKKILPRLDSNQQPFD